MPGLTVSISLIAFLAICAGFDIRQRRIPNALTVSGLLLALFFAALEGAAPFAAALASAGIAFAISLPLFLAGGFGGGDVKLLTAAAAFLSPSDLPLALLCVALVGGLLALGEILRRGALRRSLTNLRLIIGAFGPETFSRWRDRGNGGALTIDSPGAVTVPYAVAVALGIILAQLVP